MSFTRICCCSVFYEWIRELCFPSFSVVCVNISRQGTLRPGNESGSLVEVEAFVCDLPKKHPLRLCAIKGAFGEIDAAIDEWAKILVMSGSSHLMKCVPSFSINDVWWMVCSLVLRGLRQC